MLQPASARLLLRGFMESLAADPNRVSDLLAWALLVGQLRTVLVFGEDKSDADGGHHGDSLKTEARNLTFPRQRPMSQPIC